MQIGPLPAGARHLPGDDVESAPLNTGWSLPWAPELLLRIHQGGYYSNFRQCIMRMWHLPHRIPDLHRSETTSPGPGKWLYQPLVCMTDHWKRPLATQDCESKRKILFHRFRKPSLDYRRNRHLKLAQTPKSQLPSASMAVYKCPCTSFQLLASCGQEPLLQVHQHGTC
jgi:hypothetical protein